MHRLFVGTFLASDQQQTLGELESHKNDLQHSWQCRVRLVKPDKLHLTWLFLGDTDMAKDPEIATCLESIAGTFNSFAINYDQVEIWPSVRRPQLLVLTPKVIPDDVMQIATAVSSRLSQFQHKKEEEQVYRPHVTLARLQVGQHHHGRAPQAEIPQWLSSHKLWPIVHEINNINLIESHLGTEGDQYEILNSFKLR